MRRIAMLAALAILGISATAQSTEIYKVYVPSKAEWNVTKVKVVPNRIDDYLGGLKQRWVSGCAINEKLGVIGDCRILVSEASAGGAFNIMLVQKFVSGAMREPDGARYNAFMTEFRRGLEKAKQDALMQGYEEFPQLLR